MDEGASASFAYVIGARNEAAQIPGLVARLDERLRRYPGSQVVLVENGSTDGTYEVAIDACRAARGVPMLVRRSGPGLGNAVSVGVRDLTADVAVVTAADLPFGFSDLDRYVAAGCPPLAVGSKNHPDSAWPSDNRRNIMSSGFRAARAVLFGLRGQDTQGSVFAPASMLEPARLVSHGYFVSTEIVVRLQRRGLEVEYLPVAADGDVRPSHVSFRDSWAVLADMLRVRSSM
jgi:glycosyltransferase involved in cell wall biosynthesis